MHSLHQRFSYSPLKFGYTWVITSQRRLWDMFNYSCSNLGLTILIKWLFTFRWLGARLQYTLCVSKWNIEVLHQVIDVWKQHRMRKKGWCNVEALDEVTKWKVWCFLVICFSHGTMNHTFNVHSHIVCVYYGVINCNITTGKCKYLFEILTHVIE